MPTPTAETAKYKLTGANPIRSFLWHKLQTQLGWNAAETGNLIPITVPQQQPQLSQYTGPYIVYKWTLMPSGEYFLMREEQIAFTIYSQEEDDIRYCIAMMDDIFNKYDDSAKEINNWISLNGNPGEKKFDFKYTYTITGNGPQPAASEGGRMDGMVIIRACYVIDSDDGGFRK